MQMESKNNYKRIELILISVGMFLKLMGAGTPQLWRDEAFSVRAAQFQTDRMLKVVMKDTAPPFHYVLLKSWIYLFGNSQLSVRMPSILAGFVSLILFVKIINRCLESPIARLLALSLYITNYHIISYEQMARVYSIVVMLVLGLLICLLDIIQRKDNWVTYISISLLTATGLCSYNIFLLIGFVNLCFYLYYGTNTQRVKTFIAYGIAGLLYLPVFINFTLKQFATVKETFLPFYPIVSFFMIFTPLFAGQRPPSPISIVDGAARVLSFIIFTTFLLVTVVLCLKNFQIKSRKVKILWYWVMGMIIISYLYSLKSIIICSRYLIFFAPLICIILADLYQKKPKYVFLIAALSFLMCLYQLNVGYVYRGDSKGILQAIDYDNQSLIICPDGVAYHTAKFYSKYPMYIYDPERRLPYYTGTAIFEQQDYFDGNLTDFRTVYSIYLSDYDVLDKKLAEGGFIKQKKKKFKSTDYEMDKWVKTK